jgi:S-adenosyl-L-methionine hydrolase (adenosine-forming)
MRIALLTDFGTRDPYVAAMKGVIASRTDAAIHDLTHEIEPFDIFGAAWFLKCVTPWWPRTVFVCVVDPGVGTSRKIMALQRGDQVFLAPDNGLLTLVAAEAGSLTAVSVENESLFLPQGSTTFHGRDRFAPVAATLANGTSIDTLGPPMRELVCLDYAPPVYGCTPVEGTIVWIDRFGNGITDIEAARLVFPRFALRVGQHVISRIERTYEGQGPFLIVGSTGHLEISLAAGSAAAALQFRRGDRVTVVPV